MKSNKAFSIKGFAKRLWADDRGQSTTEYILILSVVVMIAMKFKTTFNAKITTAVDKLGGNIDSFVDSTSAGN